ncbi:MAG: RimK family alpha-L-glutamate ligase [Myxococcales bacterium]|nr:RimK family alpha-L-glutamate ligase [Myxococcales bacterium]
MHLLILSRKASLYSTRRLTEAARARGHVVSVIDPLEFSLVVSRGQPQLYFRGTPAEKYDLVLPRIGASITSYGLAVVRQFDMMGVPVLNHSIAIARSRDKLRAMQLLTKRDLDIPTTVCTKSTAYLDSALQLVEGPPAIVKLHQGTQGVGVMLAETRQSVQSTLESFWSLGQDIILQEFVAESKGRDIRVIVVGGRVVAAMRRRAKRGEFRSNLHRGGDAEGISKLQARYAKAAIAAAEVMALEVCGVDMLETRRGPRILEINSSPGLEGIERATQKDIASEIVQHAERYYRARKRLKRKGPYARDAEILEEERGTPARRRRSSR